MASGGVFKLITNDGKADKFLLGTKFLNYRIQFIMSMRARNGEIDITPRLNDIERSHVIHVNARYKPFAAIGYEYNKVKPHAGSPQLGNTVTFSLPQFGDFFHDMVFRAECSPCWSSTQQAPTQGTMVNTSMGHVAAFPKDGMDWDNTTPLARSTYTLTDVFGNTVMPGDDYRNLVNYAEYPGELIAQEVKFDVNNNPLDMYNAETTVMLRNRIGVDKMIGYKRLVGQEVEHEGFRGIRKTRITDTHQVIPSQVSALSDKNDTSATAAEINTPAGLLNNSFPESAFKSSSAGNARISNTDAPLYCAVQRQTLTAVSGHQTPKHQHPSLEVWHKLRMWFNEDVRLSIPSVSIPYGQRFITIQICTQEQLIHESSGLYVRQQQLSEANVAPVIRKVNYREFFVPGIIENINLSNVELYINNIFMNPEIHEIYIKKIGFSLIRVYRRQSVKSNSESSDSVLLSQLKWPIEYMYVGLRPVWNTDKRNPNRGRDWHRFTRIVESVDNNPDVSLSGVNDTPDTGAEINHVVPDKYNIELETMDSLTVSAHGIAFHDNFPSRFFNCYTPITFGGPAIVTARDPGIHLITFGLYPGSYQPSGHINVSRAREFYLDWKTSYVTSQTPAELVVIAIALNFLLITDGSAVLRFST